MTHSHRTIQSLYQAAVLTNTIHVTAQQFANVEELKNLQMYEFEGLVFFKACNQLWELDEETGKFHVVQPVKGRDRITFSTGLVAA